MAYVGVPVLAFNGGLNLRDQPDKLKPGQAIDLLNVTFTDLGGVRSRDGYAALTTVEGTNRYDSMTPFYTTGGVKQILAGAGNRLDGISSAGAVVASSAAPTANPHYFARFGGPTAQLVYAGNGTDQLRTWDGAAFAVPAWTGTAPTGKFVGVTPWDNRLVNARRAGSAAGDNPSTVRFSDPGVPNTWGANNYVDVTPGDGETIQGVIAWREFLFVFKESKFFRFYGTSTDSTGNPIFNYSPIDSGVGMCSPKAVCATRDGVYFLSRQGVYRTTGGAPERVSDLIAPFFTGQSVDFYQSGNLNLGALTMPAMTALNEQVFLSVPVSGDTVNSKTLVYDTRYGWWTLYDIPAAALCSFQISSAPELVFAYASGLKHIGRHSSAYTTDAGTTITSRWRGAWSDFGSADVKSIRETKVWGKGQARFALGHDFQSSSTGVAVAFTSALDTWSDGTGVDTWGDGTGSDTWGSGIALAQSLIRLGSRGTVFSVELTNDDANVWTVARMTHHVRERRVPSVIGD